MDFNESLELRKKDAESILNDYLPDVDGYQEQVLDAMNYSVNAGGKRLRPLLMKECYKLFGGRSKVIEPFMAAIEMIHNYSLVHDDLPAMDNDDFRRGKPTNHKVYGEGTAILAGDALLTLAFETMTRQKGVTAEAVVSVVKEMSIAAGSNGMVGGQSIDLESEDHAIDMDTLRRMHLGKTGALFRAAIRSGAILAGASEAQLSALTRYADAFGLAFQITDDILDVTGDEAAIGKPIGSDAKNHKSTYVTLTSLERAQELAASAVQEAMDALRDFGAEAEFLRELVSYLLKRKS